MSGSIWNRYCVWNVEGSLWLKGNWPVGRLFPPTGSRCLQRWLQALLSLKHAGPWTARFSCSIKRWAESVSPSSSPGRSCEPLWWIGGGQTQASGGRVASSLPGVEHCPEPARQGNGTFCAKGSHMEQRQALQLKPLTPTSQCVDRPLDPWMRPLRPSYPGRPPNHHSFLSESRWNALLFTTLTVDLTEEPGTKNKIKGRTQSNWQILFAGTYFKSQRGLRYCKWKLWLGN